MPPPIPAENIYDAPPHCVEQELSWKNINSSDPNSLFMDSTPDSKVTASVPVMSNHSMLKYFKSDGGKVFIYDQNENSISTLKEFIKGEHLTTINFCRSGKQPRAAQYDSLGEYTPLVKNHLNELSLCDNSCNSALVFYCRFVIPKNMREKILAQFHVSHSKTMYKHIQTLYYWPNLKQDVEKYIEQCETCMRESQSLPHGDYNIRNSILGTMPNDISGDILEYRKGKYYLCLNCHSSDFMYRSKMLFTIDSSNVIKHLGIYFNLYGRPRQVYLDSAKYFDCTEMRDYFNKIGVKLDITSALNHQSNARADITVKRIRHLMDITSLDDDRFYLAFAFENSLIKDNFSSAATKFLGRFVNQSPFPGPLINPSPFRSILLRWLKIILRRLKHNSKTKTLIGKELYLT